MSRSKILFAALACVFLAGQIPYGYLYCTAMKQRLTPRMLGCCMAHRSDASPAVSRPVELRIRHIDKSTTDRSDQRSHLLAVRDNLLDTATGGPAREPRQTFLRSYTLPLPDIVVEQRNLRI